MNNSMDNATNNAVLAVLNVKTWSGRRYDGGASVEFNRSKSAASDASRVNKLIVPKENLKPVTRAVNALRTAHYYNTLPFAQGAQLLPMANYIHYHELMPALISDCETAARQFVDSYPLLKQSAPRRLGELYNPADFPPVEVMAQKFNFKLSFMPVADANGFDKIFGLNEAEKLKIAAEYSSTLQASFDESMRVVYERLYKAIQHMAAKLKDKDAIFRDSLTSNVAELIDLLPRLNVNNEQALIDRIKEAKDLIKYTASELRHNEKAREKTATTADDILSKMAGYL